MKKTIEYTTTARIEDVQQRDAFVRRHGAKKVFVKDNYNRSTRRYEATNFDDIGDFIELKKGTIVVLCDIDY